MGYYTFPTYDQRWQIIDGVSKSLDGDSAYIVTSTLVVDLTLPLNVISGSTIKIVSGEGAKWKINQLESQKIIFGDQWTSLGVDGYIESTESGNSLELVFVSNGAWIVTGSQGIFELA